MAATSLEASRLLSPFLKAVIPSTAAVSTGDVICQRLEGKDEWDSARTLRMGTVTCLVTSPCFFLIAYQLERWVPGNSFRAIVKKTALSAVLGGGLITPTNFATNSCLAGETTDELKQKLSTRLLPTVMAGSSFWPIVNMLNFRFVAFPNRAAVGSLAGVVWNVYLSSQVNGTKAGDE